MEPVSVVASVMTAVGVGGALGAFLQARLTQHEHDEKHSRYRCLHILMQAKLHPHTGLPKLRQVRPDIQTIEDLDFELGTELLTGVVYADDVVLKALGQFIQEPNQTEFIKVGIAMRDDLWGKRRRKSVDLASVITDALAASPAYDNAVEEIPAFVPTGAHMIELKAVPDIVSATAL